jgi:hypothetical protein
MVMLFRMCPPDLWMIYAVKVRIAAEILEGVAFFQWCHPTCDGSLPTWPTFVRELSAKAHRLNAWY